MHVCEGRGGGGWSMLVVGVIAKYFTEMFYVRECSFIGVSHTDSCLIPPSRFLSVCLTVYLFMSVSISILPPSLFSCFLPFSSPSTPLSFFLPFPLSLTLLSFPPFTLLQCLPQECPLRRCVVLCVAASCRRSCSCFQYFPDRGLVTLPIASLCCDMPLMCL